MATVLEFDELPEGAQVMIATQSGGNLIGKAVPAGGGGGGGAFELIIVNDDDHVFNGDGSGGAIQLSPMSIIQCQTAETGLHYFRLKNAGCQDGWIIFMNLEGLFPGVIQVLDDGDQVLTEVNDTQPTGFDTKLPYPAFYFEEGFGWILLRSIFQNESLALAERAKRTSEKLAELDTTRATTKKTKKK